MSQEFTIDPNRYLTKETTSFYYTDYLKYERPGNPDYLNILKNTYNREPIDKLKGACQELKKVLRAELQIIVDRLGGESITLCVVPRAKAENSYQPNQLLFKRAVQKVCDSLSINDGTDYIVRCVNTRTTHLKRDISGFNNDGADPYPGITRDTCKISDDVHGKEILLIDDVYTKSKNIDEDVIQALVDRGAKTVFFFAVGYTVKNLGGRMDYTENAINVLAARTYKGIGKAWIVKNLSGDRTEDEIVTLLNLGSKVDYQITVDNFNKKKNHLKRLIDESREFIDGVVAIGDASFPPYRGDVKNSEKPIFLFYRGDLSLLRQENNNVAVIGLLKPDNDTEEIEREVVARLVEGGTTIVSGLAFGCDTIAHRQALKSNGYTVAVLPSPLNNIMPAKNKDLANQIVRNSGLLITEYLTDAKSKREMGGRYQDRDRLQALFSDVIILCASYAKNDLGNDSGSRLAMDYATNYSISRSVIYDPQINSNNPKYDLSRQLIKEEPNIIKIDKKSMLSAILKITSLKQKSEILQPSQDGLF